MANGRPYDHPLTDILIHDRRVYSEKADSLVREIVALGGQDRIGDMLLLEYNDLQKPDVPKLERVLTAIRDELREEARHRGWEIRPDDRDPAT